MRLGDGDGFVAGPGSGKHEDMRLKALEFLQSVFVGVGQGNGIASIRKSTPKSFTIGIGSSNQQKSRGRRSQERLSCSSDELRRRKDAVYLKSGEGCTSCGVGESV